MRRRRSRSLGMDWGSVIRSHRSAPRHRLARRPLRTRRLRMARGMRRLPPGVRTWGALALVALLAVGIAGGALMAYARLRLERNQVDIPSLTTPVAEEPMNVLVLGSDSREGLSPEDAARYDPTGEDAKSGRRADTIVLVHIDEKQGKAVMVHFPRDLKVTFPDGRTGKINGAYQRGPEWMVQTVEKVSGLDVHHYIEVNFAGFRTIVDALGGVNVYFERAIRDPDSGLDVPRGCVELTGERALAFVRVRKIDSDFGRIARQQLFARLLLDKVVSAGTLLNPVKVVRLVTLGSSNVTTDEGLTLGDMKDIALRLRAFDPERIDMRVFPSTTSAWSSFVYGKESEAAELFAAMRERRPLPEYGRETPPTVDTAVRRAAPPAGEPPAAPSDVRLSVLNGTGRPGIARAERDELVARGFGVVEVADADREDYAHTVVFHRPGHEAGAALVAGLYAAETRPLPATLPADGDVVLVLGARRGTAPAATASAAAPIAVSTPARATIHAC